MKYRVNKISKDKCKITLVPEMRADHELLQSGDETEIEQHYQRAVKSKFGPLAHFLCVTTQEQPGTVSAMYVMER